jgi:hypothetical protein
MAHRVPGAAAKTQAVDVDLALGVLVGAALVASSSDRAPGPELRVRSSATTSLTSLMRRRTGAGMTRSSLAWVLLMAGRMPFSPSSRAARRPIASASASSAVNIIGGSL